MKLCFSMDKSQRLATESDFVKNKKSYTKSTSVVQPLLCR